MIDNVNKRGIALISIVIAIIILMMLAGIVTYMGSDIIQTTKSTAFANDINTIYEATQEYYAVNGSLPVVELTERTATDYLEDIRNIFGEDAAESLSSELSKNGDSGATFFKVDIEKIGIKELHYGNETDSRDFFLISTVSQEIYYYEGYEIDDELHFSNVTIMEKN